MLTERFERGLAAIILALFAGLFLVDTLRTQPVLTSENYWFFDYYGKSSGQGITGELTKIFDVCAVDGCLYRNRPVNFLLELLDTRAIIGANRVAPWGFVSFARILLVFGACFFLSRSIRAVSPEVPPWTAAALGAFFAVTGQVLASSAVVSRPGKLLAAFAAAVFFDASLRARSLRALIPYTAFACIAVLGDEQVLLFLLLVTAHSLVRREWKWFPRLAGAALVTYLVFRFTLGYWAALRLANPVRGISLAYSDPRTFLTLDLRIFGAAARAWLFQIGMAFGSLSDGPVWIVTVIIPSLLALLARPAIRYRAGWEAGLPLGLLAITYVLGARHPLMLEADLVRVTYFIPAAMILLLCAALLGQRWKLFGARESRIGVLALVLLMGSSSFLAQAETKRLATQGFYAPWVRENRIVRDLLADPRLLIPPLTNWGRQFVEFARTWTKP